MPVIMNIDVNGRKNHTTTIKTILIMNFVTGNILSSFAK